MWIIEPPSSTIRRASAAYSSGVYGIAGHCSRLATAPEIAQVRITGSSRLMRVAGGKWDVPLPTLSDRLREVEEPAGVHARLDPLEAGQVAGVERVPPVAQLGV